MHICGGFSTVTKQLYPAITDGSRVFPFSELETLPMALQQAERGVRFGTYSQLVEVDRVHVEVRARGVFLQFVPPGGTRKRRLDRRNPFVVRVGAGRTTKTFRAAKEAARRVQFELVSINKLGDLCND